MNVGWKAFQLLSYFQSFNFQVCNYVTILDRPHPFKHALSFLPLHRSARAETGGGAWVGCVLLSLLGVN